jgi:uncharacterized iron-regulated membrane protein
MASYLASMLPLPPASVLLTLAGVGVVVGLAAGFVAWSRRRRARRSAVTTWAASCAARLEAIGDAGGRPRWRQETLREYALALGRAGLVDGRAAAIVDILGQEVHGREPVTTADRALVDQVLAELEAPGSLPALSSK